MSPRRAARTSQPEADSARADQDGIDAIGHREVALQSPERREHRAHFALLGLQRELAHTAPPAARRLNTPNVQFGCKLLVFSLSAPQRHTASTN